MNVKPTQKPNTDHIGKAIRKYRNEIGVTQAQFAVALGLSPTSIYRYEAGTGTPDVGTLQRLYVHSDKLGNEEAKKVFYAALSEKAFLGPAPEEWGSGVSKVLPSLRYVQVKGSALTRREQVLTIAFVLMLRNNVEESSEKMMRLLLEPWFETAKAEVDGYLGNVDRNG